MKSEFRAIGHGSSGQLPGLPKNLVITCDLAEDLNRERMLRNMRMYITDAGRKYAGQIEERYAKVVTKEAYLAELARREAQSREPQERVFA